MNGYMFLLRKFITVPYHTNHKPLYYGSPKRHPSLSGSAEDMNYYKTRRDGDLARKKAKISKKRLRHGPEFANSRKAGKVFGLASTASRLVRTAFSEMILGGSKSDMNNRMLACIRENAEEVHRLHHLPFQQLQGFEINEHAIFSSICSYSHGQWKCPNREK